jgi:hypothetical protein
VRGCALQVIALSHSIIWGLSLVGAYAALSTMDVAPVLAMLPASVASHIDPKAGAFAIAFVLVKLTGPARMMLDIAMAPVLARSVARAPRPCCTWAVEAHAAPTLRRSDAPTRRR